VRWDYGGRGINSNVDNSTANFTGLSSGIEPSLSRAIFLPLVGLKHQITVHDHTDRETRSDGERWLDIEITPNHLLTGLTEGIPCPTTQRLNNSAVAAAGTEFGPNAQQGRERRSLEQLQPVIVDLILKASVATGIRSRLTFEYDRATVWHNKPGPNQEHA
jgi:hypothetical protein